MVAKADLSSLNRLISGAAPLGGEMVEEFRNKNPNCHIGQGLLALFVHFCLLLLIIASQLSATPCAFYVSCIVCLHVGILVP